MPQSHNQCGHNPDLNARAKRGENGGGFAKGTRTTDDNSDARNRIIRDGEWEQVISHRPIDLESTAKAAKAIQRRREVRSASELLRIVLAYALCDLSMRLVGAWAIFEVGGLSDVAVRKRLRLAREWLSTLLVMWLALRRVEFAAMGGVRLRLIDASVISRPGSKGTDWRLHLSFDAGKMAIDGIEITDAHGGGTLVRHPVQPGDIEVADRGYANRKGIGGRFCRVVSVCL